MSNEKASPAAIVAAGVGAAVVIAITRGSALGMSPSDITWAIVGGLFFAVIYFGAIHYLLKGWDRLVARLRNRQIERP